jgi:CheY-like chemotaxis protein
LRVLVVDDNRENREILAAQLSRLGIEPFLAADGVTALARLRAMAAANEPCQLVLLDWHMEGMSGLQVAVEIRADDTLTRTPLIMLSSAGPLDDPGMAAAVGFEAFLTKPIREQQLHRCVVRVLSERRPTPLAAAIAAPAKSSAEQPAGLRLLLAEDNPANQTVAQMLLAKMGHAVDIASNGREALAHLSQHPYDAILMDCQMPVLDGYETTRRIRAGMEPGVNPRLPIIALTAYAMPDDRRKCLDAGMDDYVAKPVRARELREALLRCGLMKGESALPLAERAPTLVQTAAEEKAVADILDVSLLENMRVLPGRRGPSLLPELVEAFVREEPARMADLLRLTEAHDGTALARVAHTMAGSCASVGAKHMRAAALALEHAAQTGTWRDVPTRIAAVHNAWAQVRAALIRLKLYSP